MDRSAGELLVEPIRLTESIKTAVEETDFFKAECADLYDRVEQLGQVLHTTANLLGGKGRDFYDRPARRIMEQISKTLDQALSLCRKCKRKGLIRRPSNIVSSSDFWKVNPLLDAAIGDVCWLLQDKTYSAEGLPPITSTDPMLALVWDQIGLLYSSNPAEKEDGANRLASVASDNDRNQKLIVEEGGVSPLLRLLRDGNTLSARLAAINALEALAVNEEIEQILGSKAIPIFVRVLQDAPMKLQAKVALVIGKMASQDSKAQTTLGAEVIRTLLSLIVFQTMEGTLYKVHRGRPLCKVKSDAMDDGKRGGFTMKCNMSENGGVGAHWDAKSTYSDFSGMPWSSLRPHMNDVPLRQIHHTRRFSDSYYVEVSNKDLTHKYHQNDDPGIKKELMVHITYALWKLAENNVKACMKMSDSKCLLCFSKLIEKESEEVQRNAVMIVMEIAAAAEQNVELRKLAFKMNSRATKAVVEQLLKVVECKLPSLQVPCIKALGCLARTFPTKETNVITPLVNCLQHSEPLVVAEAATSLQKFVHIDNFLHLEHSKTILDTGALPPLMQLVTLDDEDVQVPVLILLCYLALHMTNSAAFHEAATLKVLKAISQTNVAHIQSVTEVLFKAIQHLELYQASSMGIHAHFYY